MIQRVQTVWMLLAALAVFLTLKFLFYGGTLIADSQYHPLLATDHLLILILTSALGTGIVINIFLFKNRKVQSRIILLAVILECIIIFLYVKQTDQYSAGSYSLWSALHILIIIFLFFAARGIYKDSKLIRDSNRLR
jgi:peptidoglycan/LPS O-acetylase OafA/YrhL